MKGRAFVDMIRIHWNAVKGYWYNIYFDQIREFDIEYVFGGFRCSPEYCTKENLTDSIDALLGKCIRLYLQCLSDDIMAILDFEFSSIFDCASIRLLVGDCNINIYIRPKLNHRLS